MRTVRAFIYVLVVMSLATIGLANLLLDPGFEDAPGGGSSSAPYWDWDTPAEWHHGGHWGDSDSQNWRSHSGTNEWAVHNWGGGQAAAGVWQEVTNSYSAGTVWGASAWFWNDNSGSVYTNSYSALKIEFFDASMTKTHESVQTFTPPGETWTQVSVTGTSAVDTVWTRFVFAVDGQGSAGALQMDDTSLDVVAVPEPLTSVGFILGVGLLFLLRKRRLNG